MRLIRVCAHARGVSRPVRPFTVRPFTVRPFTVRPFTVRPFTVRPFTVRPFTVRLREKAPGFHEKTPHQEGPR
ncbi:hypothetical protein ACNTMW_10285 [Planosporangium sp. 12N6]|uniref:hypothetical protein n=1 Tax=Planosporangium spinosum TaxID=3402278 RepID=UPI003CEA31C7